MVRFLISVLSLIVKLGWGVEVTVRGNGNSLSKLLAGGRSCVVGRKSCVVGRKKSSLVGTKNCVGGCGESVWNTEDMEGSGMSAISIGIGWLGIVLGCEFVGACAVRFNIRFLKGNEFGLLG